MSEKELLTQLHRLRAGAFRVTKQRFRNALRRSIGATPDYADPLWRHFQDSPLHYICSRTDQAQQLELVRVCLALGKEQP
jgi:hypothetical protein